MSYGWQLSGKYHRAVALCFENESMARALAHAKHAAEESSLAKSRFLANMSRELRTPLNAIIGFSEVIRDRKLGDSAAVKYSEYADDVVASARHLLSLINRILDLAKIEAGKMAFESSLFPIGEMLAECARSMEAAAAGKGLALLLDDQCAGRLALGDAAAVRQILLNLLANAVNFTAQGEVRLSARIEGPVLEIEVADTGCGIPEEMLPRILFPFERADNSFVASHSGTGLGLTPVRRLAEAHGGTCKVESAVGKGTVFVIRLPIVSTKEVSHSAA
ncbi:MAG TPA: HAMP domain-containing sensor histidine kinase [Rhizomicrobium sp.]|jgi:signal transduction histidine kinase|nr:HAMP domain-containing sensor histidine kinase [Rhizomicrobium sp.]